MSAFPYFEIVKKAYDLTIRHRWLWLFGLFIGGTTGINFGTFNYVLSPQTLGDATRLRDIWGNWLSWAESHPEKLSLLLVMALLVGIGLVIVSSLSKGAVVWATARIIEPPRGQNNPEVNPVTIPTSGAGNGVNLGRAVKVGRRLIWQILGLRALITSVFLLLLIIFAVPVTYLFAMGAVGRGIFLSLVGLMIFLPAGLVFRFLHLYGPIFIVLYNARIAAAIQLSFSLIRQKFKESIILMAFLVGLSFLFSLLVVFSLILFAVPIALLSLFLASQGFGVAISVLLWGAIGVSICYTIILGAGFAVFQNITWVLAVMDLVRARKLPEKSEAWAPEPAG